MLTVFTGVISKRMILLKGFKERLKQKKFKRETTEIREEDLNDNFELKKRFVKKDSIIYRRAKFYKSLNDMYINEMNKAPAEISAKRRRSSEETNASKKRFLEKITRLKRSSIDRLLKTKQAFL